MNMVPMNMTYYEALKNYRNMIDQNFPNTAVNNKSTHRIVQQTNTGCGGRGNNGRGNK